jgi:Flp pilus assembly protein TadG
MRSGRIRPSPAGRLHGDEGTALVEIACIAPILFTIFLGMFEYGMLYRDYLNASAAASDGAKYGAIQGPAAAGGVTADYEIIKAVRANIATLPIESIERIVIFKARPAPFGTPALARVPDACKTGATSTTWKCNVYPIANVAQSGSAFVQIEAGNTGFFNCPPTGQAACGWPPTLRTNGTHKTEIEDLGVYIKINRKKVTGMVPVSDVLEVAAVQHLEPGELE